MGLLLFNWLGYKLVIHYVQNKADRQLEARIDLNEYDESQLIEMRVPLNMPYQNNSSEFERHYGEIRIDGKYYTYVKRKIEDGILILKCLPNTQKEILKNTDNILFQANNGIDQEQNGKAPVSPFVKVIKCFLSDYDNSFANFNLNNLQQSSIYCLQTKTSFLNSGFVSPSEQPPDHLASIA